MIDFVAAVLGMLAHGAGACAFVVAAVNHLSRKSKTAEAAKERSGGLHLLLVPKIGEGVISDGDGCDMDVH